ncbi:MAG: hypothetical protein V4529_13480 [Gemmatimonadota bacterium]
MQRTRIRSIAINTIAVLAVLGAANSARAQGGATTYPRMAPVEQYLMDRTAEIALARTAAPASISRDAAVLVLGRHGFETAVAGKNGFVCFVDRGWSSAPDPDFWNPKVRVPQCENAPSAQSHLPIILKRAALALAGRTKDQVEKATTTAIATKELPPMAPGAMCYMMSKQGYAGDSSKHWPSHIMFFYSHFDPANWGANLPGSPVLGMEDTVNHLTGFAIPVQHWSDGTPAR